MDLKSFLTILLYIAVLIGAIGHILLVLSTNAMLNTVVRSLMTTSSCRIRLTEGDTVRFQTWQAIQQYNKKLKSVMAMLITGIVLLIVLTLLLIKVVSWEVVLIFILLVTLLCVDIGLAKTMTNSIKGENSAYNENKNTVLDAMKKIHTAYPMFKEDDTNTYPMSVSRLYELIIKRKASQDNDATLEDARSSLILLAKKGMVRVYEYLKLDATLEDAKLIKRSNKLACLKMGEYCSTTDLDSALHKLSIYLPEFEQVQRYSRFRRALISRMIALLFILFILLFPVFHVLYSRVGPILVGVITLVVVFMFILMM